MLNSVFQTDILFSGYYGHFNVGDDAFVEIASWGAKKYWGKNQCRFLAKQNNLPRVGRPVQGYPFSVPKSYYFQNQLLISQTDYLISAGGSTLNGEVSKRNVRHLAIERKSNKKDLKIGGIGVSIGPFESVKDERAISNYLKNCDFLAVRDFRSYEFASSLDLPYKVVNAFDLAALLPSIYEVAPDKQRNRRKVTIGVSVCPYESIVKGKDIESEEKRNVRTVELLKQLSANKDYHFKFYVFNGHDKHGDLRLTHQTISSAQLQSYEIVQYTKNTQKVWCSIAECDFMICTRLHAAIFACFSNTPFILNEYHSKCSDFLTVVGQPESLRLYNSNYDPKQISNLISDILEGKKQNMLPQHVSEMKERAELNFSSFNL